MTAEHNILSSDQISSWGHRSNVVIARGSIEKEEKY